MREGSQLRTITFLFTDIVGSTRLWERDRGAMSEALSLHDSILREEIAERGGVVFKTLGDAICAAFDAPLAAAEAAIGGQLALGRASWGGSDPLEVRMAIHTGSAEPRDGDWFGPPVNRVSRLLDVGHGGQILVSSAARELLADALPAGVLLVDLGRHRLEDLPRPERIFQLTHPDLRRCFPALRTASASRHNLPRHRTSFVGREDAIEAIRSRLDEASLVTLTGFGGAGKTRLALEIAAAVLDGFTDGVWLVELARLSDPDLVPRAIADAIGVEEEPDRPVIETVLDALRDRRTLLVLDNCEHLLDACADVADAILARCPEVRVLATSREPLGVAGEVVWSVSPLERPDPERETWSDGLGRLSSFESVRLFVERARAIRPDFELTAANADAVARLCARLEGIPLAIELAAARVAVLSPAQLDRRLDDLFRTLGGSRRAAPPHQRTLRATIDWSYELLGSAERALLARLSVFRGGFDLESVETVCAVDPIAAHDVLDLVTRLALKSLIEVEHQGAEARYGMLETVREYAFERLQERDEVATLRARHHDRFLALAEGAELTGERQADWLRRLEVEHDNLRAALEWSCSDASADACVQLAGALGRFMRMHAHFTEGRAWLERALARAGDDAEPSRPLARALRWAGSLARGQGDLDAAGARSAAALAAARAIGAPDEEAKALNGLAIVANVRGRHDLARDRWEASLELFRDTDSRRNEAAVLGNLALLARSAGETARYRALLEESLALFRSVGDLTGVSAVLNNLGVEAYEGGDLERAWSLHEESLEADRELGDRHGVARSLGNLALVALDRGEIERARELLDESLRINLDLRDRAGVASQLASFAALLLAEGRGLEAARLQGAVSALHEAVGAALDTSPGSGYARIAEDLTDSIGEETYREAWEAGRAMSEADAIASALEGTPSRGNAP